MSDHNRGKMKTLKHGVISLVRLGLKRYVCEVCGLSLWQGEPIFLDLHHVDGDRDNNSIDNLKLLCLNCHAQTNTYRQPTRLQILSIPKDVILESLSRTNDVWLTILDLKLRPNVRTFAKLLQIHGKLVHTD